MAGAGLASCSQPIPSYTVMGNIPDLPLMGKQSISSTGIRGKTLTAQ